MKLFKIIALLVLGLMMPIAPASAQAIFLLPLNDAIGPATEDFIVRGLQRAEKEHAQLLVLQLDTPGGLDTSMRAIIKAILSSPVPVATFVAPSGARAASAGTYILYASHIAAMAPATNLGAATPIPIGIGNPAQPGEAKKDADGTQNTLTRKQVHDAAAYIRSLAHMRGRNEDWAERAVREAVSLPAEEALKINVIDLIARDVPDLLRTLDQRKVSTAAGERVLHTAGVGVTTIEPDWRNRFLAVITNPSVALLLMMAGMLGLFFEFSNPGFVLPGVVGAVCLLLGLFALHLLPVNYAGLALILLGLSFMVAEAFFPSFGSLGIGGVVAFAIGAVMLIDTDIPAFGIPLPFIILLSIVSLTFILAVVGVALKTHRRPVASGRQAMAGCTGEMLTDAQPDGWAFVQSERWRVQSATPLKSGQRIRVLSRNGLVLTVGPIESE